MSVVVKVQLPLATNRPTPLALVYARGRAMMVEQPLDNATIKAMGEDVKAFFQAEYHVSTGKWSIGKRVKDRDW